jgi:hypothetical protein
MRPKVIIAILLVAAGLLGVIVLASKSLRPQSTSPASAPAAGAAPVDSGTVAPVSPATTGSSNLVSSPASNPVPVIAPATVAATNDAAAHATYVERRIEELDALAMNNDVQSRDTILSELKHNPDKAIRAAALEAAIQFNDRSVVPPLKEIAEQTQDPDEKAAILEAIDYINLPSLTEYMAAQRKQKEAGASTTPQSQPSGSGE